jgi:hypothetical protein
MSAWVWTLPDSAMARQHRINADPAERTASGRGTPQAWPVRDRRGRRRLPLDLPVRIETRLNQTTGSTAIPLAVNGCTRDISNQGAYMWSRKRFEAGQPLHLTLEVPPDQGRNWGFEILCEAEVLRVETGNQRTGMAVRFLRFEIPKVSPAS